MGNYALILAGGSIKGCWQAGAIAAVIEKKGLPSHIYGISVGSLNATLLAQFRNAWRIVSFWRENVTKPSDIVRKRPWYELVWQILRKDFKGYLDTTPLRKLIERTIVVDNAANSIQVQVGIVDIDTAKIFYHNRGSRQWQDWCEILMGSTAMPIIMPPSYFNNGVYFDGGLRDIAPLTAALKAGHKSIVVIACSPRELTAWGLHSQEPIKLLLRTLDILTNECLNNDLDAHEHIGPDTDHPVDITVIRPKDNLDIDIEKFTRDDIAYYIQDGYNQAKEILK